MDVPNLDLPAGLSRSPGEIVLTGTRLRLLDIVRQFRDGLTAEQIREHFELSDVGPVRAAVDFYTANRTACDTAIRDHEVEFDRLRGFGTPLDLDELRRRAEAARPPVRAGA